MNDYLYKNLNFSYLILLIILKTFYNKSLIFDILFILKINKEKYYFLTNNINLLMNISYFYFIFISLFFKNENILYL